VLIVCSEIPVLERSLTDKVDYLQMDMLSVPVASIEKETDKNRRIWKGLNVFVNDPQISHVMILDADDCISSALVGFVISNTSIDGWFINSGYEYPEGRRIVYFRDHDIHYRTGSSHIISTELLRKYADMPFESVDIEFLYHQNICAEMRASNTPLEPFPFPAVAYVVENGENIYCNRKKRFLSPKSFMDAVRIYGGIIRRAFIARSLSDEIRSEFSLYSISVRLDSKQNRLMKTVSGAK
jgi:hypothetical protein